MKTSIEAEPIRQELTRLNTALAEIEKCLSAIVGYQHDPGVSGNAGRPVEADVSPLSHIDELVSDAHGFANMILEQAHIITARL